MTNSLFRNSRALIAGALAAVLFFGAFQLFLAVRGPQYAEPGNDPGTITVRPIVKDKAVSNLVLSIAFGLGGGIVTARAIHRRSRH